MLVFQVISVSCSLAPAIRFLSKAWAFFWDKFRPGADTRFAAVVFEVMSKVGAGMQLVGACLCAAGGCLRAAGGCLQALVGACGGQAAGADRCWWVVVHGHRTLAPENL